VSQKQQKDQLYSLFAQIGKTLSSPKRLELLELLTQAPRPVEELADEAQMSIASTSQHLQKLKQARLVFAERDGSYMRYHLTDPVVSELWRILQAVAQHQLVEIEHALDAYRHRHHEFERITMPELKTRLQTGDVVLIDARPPVEFQTGHLAGALSASIDEIEQMLDSLPEDKLIVAYCRGPYCVLADEVLAVLAEQGLAVARLEEGVLEWEAAGYPVNRL
jgi:rhodanese-related sulfurtransferase/biotin operon repressor